MASPSSNQPQISKDHIDAFILAGGASRRMGTDKSQLLIGEKSFIEHVTETLFQVTDSVTIVGRDSTKDVRVKTTEDIFPAWGALGGLHAALANSQTEWTMVIACDLPFITPELLFRLLLRRANYEAIVPIQPDGRPQPLCACYRTNVCLKTATELIADGKRRPLDLLENVNSCWVPFAELQDLEHANDFFVNINTPEDYYEATRKDVS